MGNVLVICEHENNELKTSALSAISFARQAAGHHGGNVSLLLMGNGAQGASAHAAKFGDKVLVCEDAGLSNYLAETYAPVIAHVAKAESASVVCGTATAMGKDVMPRVTALLDAGMASDIATCESKDTFKRAVSAGNAISTVQVTSPTICITIRQSNFTPAAENGGSGDVANVAAGDLNALGAEFIKLESSKGGDRPDLNDADTVVSGGRGMGNGDNFAVLGKLADSLGAAMGASRAATDAGYVPADWQVGQTGKIVAPKLYFAVAISGAIQHLAGMKNSKTIVAINKDPDAPIFQVADYGLVAKWEDTVEELAGAIASAKA